VVFAEGIKQRFQDLKDFKIFSFAYGKYSLYGIAPNSVHCRDVKKLPKAKKLQAKRAKISLNQDWIKNTRGCVKSPN
jgi:hypothetical protein